MKNLLFFIGISALAALSFTDPYTQAMMKGKDLLEQAQDQQDFRAASNQFARIAEREHDKWLPAYYAGYAMTMVAAMEATPEAKDEVLDHVQTYLDKIASIEHNECEALALQGFVYMLRISVDPATRGPEYSAMSAASLQKAKSLDENNPRVLHLLAQLSFGSAQFFGSDTSEACQLNDLSLEEFISRAKEVEDESLDPNWGQNMAQAFKAQCEN